MRKVSPETPSSWTSKSFKEDSKLTYTHVKWLKLKCQTIPSIGKDMEEPEFL